MDTQNLWAAHVINSYISKYTSSTPNSFECTHINKCWQSYMQCSSSLQVTSKQEYEISSCTLRLWANTGKLDCVRMGAAGKRLYSLASLDTILYPEGTSPPQTQTKNFIYALWFGCDPQRGTAPTGPASWFKTRSIQTLSLLPMHSSCPWQVERKPSSLAAYGEYDCSWSWSSNLHERILPRWWSFEWGIGDMTRLYRLCCALDDM